MKLIAHRGLYKNKIEENTLTSFKNAINSVNYIGFEFDIHMSRDKKFIVKHSPYINNKLIKNLKLKDIKNYLLLEDVLKQDTDKIFLIEIKDYDLDYIKLNNILNKYKSKKIYVMSFHNHVLNELMNLKHNYLLGSLNYILNDINDYKYDFICLLDNISSKNKINKYLKLNKEVFIYGITNLKDYINYNKELFYIV